MFLCGAADSEDDDDELLVEGENVRASGLFPPQLPLFFFLCMVVHGSVWKCAEVHGSV